MTSIIDTRSQDAYVNRSSTYAIIIGPDATEGHVLRLIDATVDEEHGLDQLYGNGRDDGHGPQYVAAVGDVVPDVGDRVVVGEDGVIEIVEN